MEKNLLDGMEDLPQDKRNKFFNDNIYISDLKQINDRLGGTLDIKEILTEFLEEKKSGGLSVNSMYLIYKNIIDEFKTFDVSESVFLSNEDIIINTIENSNQSPVIYKMDSIVNDYFYHFIITQAFENTSHIITMDLTHSVIDLDLAEIYDFYQDIFDILEKKIWDINFMNCSSFGFMEFYKVLENLTADLDYNQNYKDKDKDKYEEKKKIKDMFDGMKQFKEKIVPLEFDYQLKHYADFHSKEEVENNKISNRDKVMYFSRINFKNVFKNFLDDEINSFLKNLKAEELNNYTLVSKTVQKDDYMQISFDRDDQSTRLLANKLNLFIEKNKIRLQDTHFFKDPKKLHFGLRFKNKQNTELEAEVFKEFMRSLVEFLTKNDDIDNAVLEMNELMRGLDNSLREVELLSKLESKNHPVMNKKKKI